VALPQVLKAVRNGRLERSLGTNAKGRPCIADGALAEQEWRENRDLRKVRGPTAPAMADERRRLVAAQARRAELDNDKTAGELVSRRQVELTWSRLVVEARTALLGLPSRFKQCLPHLTTADLAVIDSLIRQCLEGLADHGDGPRQERVTKKNRAGRSPGTPGSQPGALGGRSRNAVADSRSVTLPEARQPGS
jgi:phage terminase Nu1 subunit (DNA packaging protein)